MVVEQHAPAYGQEPLPAPSNLRMNLLAAALIAAGVGVPMALAALALLPPYEAGQALAGSLFTLALLALVAWLLVRKASPARKAVARVWVGVVFALVSLIPLAHDLERFRDAKVLVRDLVAIQETFSAKTLELNEQFAKLQISKRLDPSALAAPGGAQAGLAEVARFRELIAQRDALASEFNRASDARVAAVGAADLREDASKGLEMARAPIRQLYPALNKSQIEFCDAAQALLLWVDKHPGGVILKGGQVLAPTSAELSEFNALADRLASAESAAVAVGKQVQAANEQQLEQARLAREQAGLGQRR